MQLVMFDVDGTLTHSVAADEVCFLQALRDVFGLDDVDTDWATYPHCSDFGILETIFQRAHGRSFRVEEAAAMQDRFVTLLEASTTTEPIGEIPGAREFVRQLSSRTDWSASLASGAWERSVRIKLACAGFDVAHLAGAFAEDGPARESIMQASYARAARACGRETFDAVTYLGDGVWDARASRNLGWTFIGIAHDPVRAQRLRDEGAEHLFADYRDAEAVLNGLQRTHPST